MGTAAKQFVGIRLQLKWRLKEPNEDPGGWTSILFNAAALLGDPGVPLTAHELHEEIESGIPSLNQKQLTQKERDKVKAAPDAWKKLAQWLGSIGVTHSMEILPEGLGLAGEPQYQLDPLTNRVSDFAGHVWLIRETAVKDDYRHTDFLPNFQALRQKLPPAHSLADFLEYYIFPLRSKAGVPGRFIARKFFEEQAEDDEWQDDRKMGDASRSHEIIIPMLPADMTGVSLPTGNYGFNTDPPAVHNCLTWASAVLKFKSRSWFCSHFNTLSPKDLKELHEHFFDTGSMQGAYRIIFNGDGASPPTTLTPSC